jgi:hypothetical protein
MTRGEPGVQGWKGWSRRERNPKRGASAATANPRSRATRFDADEGLEVEAVMAWQPGFAWVSVAPATARGHGPLDEGGPAAAGEKPLDGDKEPWTWRQDGTGLPSRVAEQAVERLRKPEDGT